jgi:hypothetical protein
MAVKMFGPVNFYVEVSGLSSMARMNMALPNAHMINRKINRKVFVSFMTSIIMFISTAKVSKVRSYIKKQK